MTVRISQIIKLIEITIQHQNNKKANQEQVKKDFELQPISNALELPDYELNKKFCMDAEILIFENNFITLTPLGSEIIKYSNSNKNLKKFMLEKCFSNDTFSKKIFDILTKFHNDGKGRLWYEKNQIWNLFKQSKYLDIFYETKLLIRDNGTVVVNPLFVKHDEIKKHTGKKRKFPLKELEIKLEHWKLIGEIGEERALNYEKTRLKKEKLVEESELVRRISFDDTNAGYDIESFTGNVPDGIPNRFIEVKGTVGKEMDFHWSSNEMDVAKEFGDLYWLYFVREIDVDSRLSPHDPKMIQNPYKNIYENISEFDRKTEGYYFKKKSQL